MKIIVKIGYIITSIIFLIYLSIPNTGFPQKPDESLQSDEPADTESIYRRAYFTNFDREEVLNHYLYQMKKRNIFTSFFPTYRLNYPPEESQTIIRDQTRSTFLEEIVQPFRESIFINGFEPKNDKDAVIIQDKLWRQKIIVKKVESNVLVRMFIGALVLMVIPLVTKILSESANEFRKVMPRIWTYR